MKKFFRFSTPSLKKSEKILTHSFHLFTRKQSQLSEAHKKTLEKHLRQLQESILNKESASAKRQASELKALIEDLLPRTSFEKTKNFVVALSIALCLALLIRQTIFEFYEIPTGSMRPTLKEKDRLMVTKTSFGINIPFRLGHFYFDPNLVQRNDIVVFSGEDMDIRDVDTRYFYLFPGKKQYVKRLIGKPGDTLYFYGGLIYGIDKDGNDISHELQLSRLNSIEHIPFIQFEGKAITPPQPTSGVYNPVLLYQMNEPVAKLFMTGHNHASGEMLPILVDANKTSVAPPSYGDLWGIKNFGMGRLLTKQEVLQHTNENISLLPEGVLYLEIEHNPSLKNIKIKRDLRGRTRPMLGLSTSLIPLSKDHIQTLFNNLYTARFVVKDGLAYRYGMDKRALQSPFSPKLSDVPDGTYEFYFGKAYKISFEGIASELPSKHPLYRLDPARVQLFYNLGIEFDTRIMPQNKYLPIFPSRYLYFRDGALYAMGAPLFLREDPMLEHFSQLEISKQASIPNYEPFVDQGAPLLSDGTINSALVRQLGLSIPEKMYLMLGDNHAMSADSREFGFVPEKNLKGAPDFIFWPPGSRFGHPNQPPYPFMNFPRSVVWVLVAISAIGYSIYYKRKNKLPLL